MKNQIWTLTLTTTGDLVHAVLRKPGRTSPVYEAEALVRADRAQAKCLAGAGLEPSWDGSGEYTFVSKAGVRHFVAVEVVK